MAEELAYVILTPYSIRKSRTGGILSRLLSRSGLELVSGRMFAPSQDLIDAYAQTIVTATEPRHRRTQELIRAYVQKNLAPNPEGKRRRVLMLVLRGENAVDRVLTVAGHIVHERTSGETIRDTYGDYHADGADGVRYFEPAVLCAPNRETAAADMQLWARHSDADGGVLENIVPYPEGAEVQKTLVLIKPEYDAWKPAEHNGTFRGNNHAFVTATAAINTYWRDDSLMRELADKAGLLKETLNGLVAEFPEAIIEHRGRGFLQGIVFADPAVAADVSKRAFEKHLIIERAGVDDEVVKFMPALTIDEATLREGISRVVDAVREAIRGARGESTA